MEICKTDVQRIIKYLDDAATLYDTQPGQRNNCRAWVLRQMRQKLQKRLLQTSKTNSNEKNRHR